MWHVTVVYIFFMCDTIFLVTNARIGKSLFSPFKIIIWNFPVQVQLRFATLAILLWAELIFRFSRAEDLIIQYRLHPQDALRLAFLPLHSET